MVIFSYFGTEIAVTAAAELEDPARGIRQGHRDRGVAHPTPRIHRRPRPSSRGTSCRTLTSSTVRVRLRPLRRPRRGDDMSIVIFMVVCSVLNSGLYSAARMFSLSR
ncbi:hypothetical protein QJS66_10315 [Kocuria rhizophila]|nr:hypothetical protein QJS66_10315 [Kocuria rhizophila]